MWLNDALCAPGRRREAGRREGRDTMEVSGSGRRQYLKHKKGLSIRNYTLGMFRRKDLLIPEFD